MYLGTILRDTFDDLIWLGGTEAEDGRGIRYQRILDIGSNTNLFRAIEKIDCG